jgi:tetratricopeptide (TPR) repeat protein
MTIAEQLNNIDWKNHNQVIDFYESNLVYFENYQLISDQEKISDFIDIKLHYSNSLFENSHFEKVIKITEQVEQLLSKLNTDHWNFEQSKIHAQFLKGMSFGNMKKFKESYPIFKTLIKTDPDNHYYQIWYNYSRLGLYNWIFNGLVIIGGILIFGDLLFNLSENFKYDVGIIGVIILLTSYLSQQGLKIYFKRKKTATNTQYKKLGRK